MTQGDSNFNFTSYANNPFVPACRLWNSTALSLTNLTNIVVLFDTIRFDTDNMAVNAKTLGQIKFRTPGLYFVYAGGAWDFNATGNRQITIRKNGIGSSTGSVIGISQFPTVTDNSQGTSVMSSTFYYFVAGDWIVLNAYQSSGGSLNFQTANDYSPVFGVFWVAPYPI